MARRGHLHRLDGRERGMMLSALLQSSLLLPPLWIALRNKLFRHGETTAR